MEPNLATYIREPGPGVLVLVWTKKPMEFIGYWFWFKPKNQKPTFGENQKPTFGEEVGSGV